VAVITASFNCGCELQLAALKKIKGGILNGEF